MTLWVLLGIAAAGWLVLCTVVHFRKRARRLALTEPIDHGGGAFALAGHPFPRRIRPAGAPARSVAVEPRATVAVPQASPVPVPARASVPVSSAPVPTVEPPRLFEPVPLLTAAEAHFLDHLVHSLPPGMTGITKVRVSDLIQARAAEVRERKRLNALLNQKHVDFVVLGPNQRVIAAIELDDSSHDRPERVARDTLIDHAFAEAQLPLLRVKTNRGYPVGELSQFMTRLAAPPAEPASK